MSLASGATRLLLISPIIPSPTGNGLAMRAALAVEGLAQVGALSVAVLPVSDPEAEIGNSEWASQHCDRVEVVPLLGPHESAVGWLQSGLGRSIVRASRALPERARQASPALGHRLRSMFLRRASMSS